MRTEFVSGVSHEMRTPLAQIRWFAELLHLGKLRSEDERTGSAGIIDREARRLTYLVENVLNFSRAEKGTNRVSAGRLQRIAEILNTPVMFFYSGMGAGGKKRDPRSGSLAFLQTKGAIRLIRAYSEIGSRATKYALVVLAESLRNEEKG